MITAPEKITTPIEPTTEIKRSEAMRLGSLISEKTDGVLFDTDGRGGVYACAIGAAWLGAGNPATDDEDIVYEWFGGSAVGRTYRCPAPEACGMKETVSFISYHLNDHHGWNRGKIADWLESQGL